MKKLFSILGLAAIVSLCLFNSCKDEDEHYSISGVDVEAINKAEAAALNDAAQQLGITEPTYTYVVNGQNFNNAVDLANYIASLPAGSTVKVTTTISGTDAEGNKVVQSEESYVTTPAAGETGKVEINVPGTDKDITFEVEIPEDRAASHSGGQGR